MELRLSICVPYSFSPFSVLRRETNEIPDAALRPTSIRFGCDAKTAICDAPAEGIGEMPLQ